MEITSFKQLVEFQDNLPKNPAGEFKFKWIFRGDKYNENPKEDDSLKTTLEKAFEQFGVENSDKLRAEKDIIREFQRKIHHYTSNIPPRADIQQWLALMQHHGAPTRLLDWTYSFWVAVHFAIMRLKPGQKAIVWAVNGQAILPHQKKCSQLKEVKNIRNTMEKNRDLPYCDADGISDNALVHYLIQNDKPEPAVYALTSFRLNQRITIQQGTFLITGDITQSFRNNLFADKYPDMKTKNVQSAVIDINKKKLKVDIAKKLRDMNINNAVLFPGLEGFSESLWTRVGLALEDKLWNKEKDLTLYP